MNKAQTKSSGSIGRCHDSQSWPFMIRSRNLPLHRPVQVVQAGLKLGEVLLGALFDVWRYGDFMLDCWSVGRCHDSQSWPFAVRSSKPASPSTSPNGLNKPEALQYVQAKHTPPSASPSSSNQPEVAYQHRFPSAHKIAKVQSRQEFT